MARISWVYNKIPQLQAALRDSQRLLLKPAAVLVRAAKDSVRTTFQDRGERANFQREVGFQRTAADRIVVGSTHPGAYAQEFGSRPYVIRVRHKKSLAWPADGNRRRTPGEGDAPDTPRRSVRHPGLQATRWFGRALEAATPAMREAYGESAAEIIIGVVGRR